MLVRYRTHHHPIRREAYFPSLWNDTVFKNFWKGFKDQKGEELKVEVSENKKSYLVRAEFPGFGRDDIKVELEDGVLTLHAETKDEKWDQDEDEGWRSIETQKGSFHRRLRLPEDVDEESIKAKMNKGVLRLTLPKSQEKPEKLREIEIQ